MKNRNRKPNRLRNYDYSQAGYYFVTICTQNKQLLFGKIIDRQMVTNDAGRMVERTWNELPKFYRGIQIDQFQIMPNHLHGIIIIVGTVGTGPVGTGPVGTGPRACPKPKPGTGTGMGQPQGVVPTVAPAIVPATIPAKVPRTVPATGPATVPATGPATGPTASLSVVPALSLSDIIHRFKSFTTHRYMEGVKNNGWKSFDGKLWQRSFYDHIIRNEESLDNIRAYIQNNPLKWESDTNNSRN